MRATRIRFSAPLARVTVAAEGASAASQPQLLDDEVVRQQLEQDRRQITEVLSEMAYTVRQTEDRRQESFRELREAAVELAVAIASQVAQQAIEKGEYGIDELVRKVVEGLDVPGLVRVRLHPEDLALLERRFESGVPPWKEMREIELLSDARIQRGDCRADALDFGVIAKLKDRIAEIRDQLLNSIDDAQTERRTTQSQDESLRRFPDRRETA